MNQVNISRENFDRLLTYTMDQYVQKMLRRYIGFSEQEANEMMPEILQYIWDAAQADQTVFYRLPRVFDMAITQIGMNYLRRQRGFLE